MIRSDIAFRTSSAVRKYDTIKIMIGPRCHEIKDKDVQDDDDDCDVG